LFLFFAGVSGWAQDCERYSHLTLDPSLSELEEEQHCLNEKLEDLETSNGLEILNLQDKLEQTERDLHTARASIFALEDRLNTAEERIEMLEFSARRMTPKPKAAASSKPTPDANKAKSPTDKPKPAVDSPKNQ
jgi:chromosome segregation ATPase